MKPVRVIQVEERGIMFEGNIKLYSKHKRDCCESHYLDFSDLTMEDFEGLLFDLSGDDFFERVEGYGIRLKPLNGHPVPIPGYGVNNGYYSTNLTLVLECPSFKREYKISECQKIKWTD